MDIIAQSRRFSSYLDRLLNASRTLNEKLPKLVQQPISLADFEAFADWCTLNEQDTLMAHLRQLRQETMARLICRDIAGLADLDEVMTGMSDLAEFSLAQAMTFARQALIRYGEPVEEDSGSAQKLIIIAMGKLGGRELNVSSDIDLIFIYPEEGETNGSKTLSNHEYFTKMGQLIIKLLDDITPEGKVFRMDMRLRPYGESGPLVMSMEALENYLMTQGREWERYAWIKARALSGDTVALNSLIQPFIYRKYLDYGAYSAMRELYGQIRREATRRNLNNNIKLGVGGIREVEFIVQLFQLVRGGREKSLQGHSTRHILTQIGQLQLLPEETVAALQTAYVFLRNLEHRLQYVDDQQTQTLPTDDSPRLNIAHSMGFTDWTAFYSELNRHRGIVTRHFEEIFLFPEATTDQVHPLNVIWQDIHDTNSVITELDALGFQDPTHTQTLLRSLADSSRYQHLSVNGQKKIDALIGPLLEAATQTTQPDTTLIRLLDLLEAIERRSAYLSLLGEHHSTLNRLAQLYSASSWLSGYITRHPVLLDELLDSRLLYTPPDWSILATQLEKQLAECDDSDTEAKMDVLRHFQHAQIFHLAVQELAGMWTVEAISDELSLLADLILQQTLIHAWRSMPKRHRDMPQFAIIGYGKLGGKELGYASDLDIIFIYDDDHPDAPDLYAKLARRLPTWLTSATSAGNLYEIDLRLRPDGASGMLISRMQAFAEYQQHKAWVWEHQALTRARYIVGDADIGQQFEQCRHHLLTMERNQVSLRQSVIDIREKMFVTHPPVTEDIKYARGGVVDVEFIVQYLILSYAHQLPELTRNSGNIALLGVAGEAGLVDAGLAQGAQQAYRHYRRQQHVSALRDEPEDTLTPERLQDYQTVCALWTQVFGEAPASVASADLIT